MSLWTWLVAFFSMVFLDMAWVLYMREASRNKPAKAAVAEMRLNLTEQQ